MKFCLFRKKTIVGLLLVALACFGFAACNKTFLPEKNGYTAVVVYDANGGIFGNADTTVKTYKYKPSVSIMEPGGKQNSQFFAPTMTSKHISAWYAAVLDDKGEPIKTEDGQFQLSEKPWNFATDKLPDTEGFKLYLVAVWASNYKLIVDVGEEARADGVANFEYTDYKNPGPVSQPGLTPEWTGHTFYYYRTEEGRRLKTSEDWATLVLSDENPEITVYAEWLSGVWKIVSNADQLKAPLSGNYILDNDIDMNGKEFGNLINYRGTFEGNGHTISNFKTSIRQGGRTQTEIGLFDFIGNGCVRNVTFKDASLFVTLTTELVNAHYSVGFFCGSANSLDLSRFENIGFVDCALEVKRDLGAKNIPVVFGVGVHFGIFGSLAEGQSFTPAEGSNAVSVKLDGVSVQP